MTDDIVTRLREGKGDDTILFGMMYEAADEIERLRAEVAYLKQGWYPTPATVQSYAWWRKEWS